MKKIAINGKRNYSIDLLKIFAIVLIINSHFDDIYPIKSLATGGAIGNGIFFIITGFLSVNVDEKFFFWFLNKLKRIYPQTLIATLFSIFLFKFDISLINIILNFIWPTYFWFSGAIILFYIPYYFIIKRNAKRNIILALVILLIIYFGWYIFFLDKSTWIVETNGLKTVNGFFKLIYYFQIMLLGGFIRLFWKPSLYIVKKSCYLRIMILSFLFIYFIKSLMSYIPTLYQYQFLNQFGVIVFSYCALKFTLLSEKRIDTVLSNMKKQFIKFASSISLEIYLVQFIAIDIAKTILFPFNALLALILCVVFSILLKLISDKLVMYFYGFEKKT